MRLNRIELENFMGHRSLTLALGRRTLIVGENGAGKSSVKDAIALALTVRPDTPTKFAPVAEALTAVHSRARAGAVGFFSVWIASAKFTPVRFKPVGSALPPLMPAKALRPEPPMVSCSTVTAFVDSLTLAVLARSPSLTVVVFLFSARAPETWKKPKASMVRLPEALVTSPSEAARSSVTVLGLETVPV